MGHINEILSSPTLFDMMRSWLEKERANTMHFFKNIHMRDKKVAEINEQLAMLAVLDGRYRHIDHTTIPAAPRPKVEAHG